MKLVLHLECFCQSNCSSSNTIFWLSIAVQTKEPNKFPSYPPNEQNEPNERPLFPPNEPNEPN